MSTDNPWFTYVFVRRDIPVVQQIIQVGHACYEAASFSDDAVPTPNICLFEVENEAELISISDQLKGQGIGYSMFYEPDRDMGFSALATAALRGEKRAKFLSYRRWGGDKLACTG